MFETKFLQMLFFIILTSRQYFSFSCNCYFVISTSFYVTAIPKFPCFAALNLRLFRISTQIPRILTLIPHIPISFLAFPSIHSPISYFDFQR